VVEATLPENAALAVFDAVTSNSGVALPLERIIAVCRQRCARALLCCVSCSCTLSAPRLCVQARVTRANHRSSPPQSNRLPAPYGNEPGTSPC
jgi:hypothetical protein